MSLSVTLNEPLLCSNPSKLKHPCAWIEKVRSYLIQHGFSLFFRMTDDDIHTKLEDLTQRIKNRKISWEQIIQNIDTIAPELDGRLRNRDWQAEKFMHTLQEETQKPQKSKPRMTKVELQQLFNEVKGNGKYWDIDNGKCNMRANHVAGVLRRRGVPMKQVTLELLTGPQLGRNWCFHIAAAVTLDDGTKWVIDPAIDSEGPIPIEKWAKKSHQDPTTGALPKQSTTRHYSTNMIQVNREEDLITTIDGNLMSEPFQAMDEQICTKFLTSDQTDQNRRNKKSIEKTTNATRLTFQQYFKDHSKAYPSLCNRMIAASS